MGFWLLVAGLLVARCWSLVTKRLSLGLCLVWPFYLLIPFDLFPLTLSPRRLFTVPNSYEKSHISDKPDGNENFATGRRSCHNIPKTGGARRPPPFWRQARSQAVRLLFSAELPKNADTRFFL
jgi:hypothetical protein